MEPNRAQHASGRPQDCPHRELTDASSTGAVCALVRRALGVEGPAFASVAIDACTACCASTPPTEARWNGVIASLVHRDTTRIIEAGGVDGCDAERAAEIKEFATSRLRVEDASGDSPPDVAKMLERGDGRRCAWVGDPLDSAASDAVYACGHPSRATTTLEACRLCRDWCTDRFEPRPASRLAEFGEGSFAPALRPVAGWAVGVTSSPRRQDTLDLSLDSIRRAGFQKPHLFFDDEVPVAPRHQDLPRTVRSPPAGAWPNWYAALLELLLREPDAEGFVIVQDDVVLYDVEDLAAHLSRGAPFARDVGAVSLYCSSRYDREATGWHRLDNVWVWGACAFAFERSRAKELVTDPLVLEHRWAGPNGGLRNIDAVVGEWARRRGLRVVFPVPSLAQHVGHVSTLWPLGTATGRRRAATFAGDP